MFKVSSIHVDTAMQLWPLADCSVNDTLAGHSGAIRQAVALSDN